MKYSIRNRFTGLTHTGMTRNEVENYFSSRNFGDYSFTRHANKRTYTLSGPDGNINTNASLSQLCDMYEYSLLPDRLALRSWVQMQPGRARVTSVVR